MQILLLVCVCFSFVCCDIYLHAPRGSNNRLDERAANRQTANRLFDSQNNNKGGYNVGDRTNNPANGNAANQYQMKHFMSAAIVNQDPATTAGQSVLPLEWTGQHGAGGNENTNPNKLNANYVIQFLAQAETGPGKAQDNRAKLRDGTNRGRNQYQQPGNNERESSYRNRRNANQVVSGLQEQLEWYDKCKKRRRNKGLFTADQNLNGDDSTKTRQNPNGNRNGYECPEERDYYPYWHPTEWKDIAIMADNITMCEYYQKESFNVKPKYECVEKWTGSATQYKHYSEHNNQKDCEDDNGQWLEFHNYLERTSPSLTEAQCTAENNKASNKANKINYIWARPMRLDGSSSIAKECLVALKAPDCKAAAFSRDNHLGNGADLEAIRYDWVLPHFPSNRPHRIVFRIRYNITTDDYDPWFTDAEDNENNQDGTQSPVEQNPAVDIGALNIPMRLAINTAQYGRTFQDRSHMFWVQPRPSTIQNERVMNLQVRGKRGNIVQTYPAVEYDFFPTNMSITKDDLVHFQWTGSNTHNNQNPAGDGQAGDDGEGKGGTDRSNILGLADRLDNFPLPLEDPRNLVQKSSVVWAADINTNQLQNYNKLDVAVMLASAGYYKCVERTTCTGTSVQSKNQMNNLLNNAPASFEGVVLKIQKDEEIDDVVSEDDNNEDDDSAEGDKVDEDKRAFDAPAYAARPFWGRRRSGRRRGGGWLKKVSISCTIKCGTYNYCRLRSIGSCSYPSSCNCTKFAWEG